MSYLHNLRTYQDVPTRPDDDETVGLEKTLLVKYYHQGLVKLTITLTYDLVDGEEIAEHIEFVTEHKERYVGIDKDRPSHRWINRDIKESLSAALIDCQSWDIESLVYEQVCIWSRIKGGVN